MENERIVVQAEVLDPVKSDKLEKPDLGAQAWEQVISTIPNVINTIASIANQYATTHHQVILLQEQGRKMLTDTYAYIKKVSADQSTLEKRGQIILSAMDKVHQTLADPSVPELARVAYAQQLSAWVQTLVAAVSPGEKPGA